MNRDKQTMRWARLALALGLTLGAAGGCGGDDGGGGEDDAGSTGGDSGTSTGDAGKTDAGKTDSGSGDAGTETDAGTQDSGVAAVPGTDAPTLAAVGLYNDELGPRILVEGSDPNGDVAKVKISYFKGTQAAVVGADPENQVAGKSSDEPAVEPVAGKAGFVYTAKPSAEFFDSVDTIKVIAYDKDGRPSAELTASLGKDCDKTGDKNCAKRVNIGAACDPWGFDRCIGGSLEAGVWKIQNLCSATNAGYKCASQKDSRRNACTNAKVLDPDNASSLSVIGKVAAPSLWDAPGGCTTASSRQPDAVVRLHLATAKTVTVSTDSSTTNFDTLVYKLGTFAAATDVGVCETSPAECTDPATCYCAQDIAAKNTNSSLTLTNLPAGDHYIVVERFPSKTKVGDKWVDVTNVDFELKIVQ